jgi:hypothetical protein
MEGKMRPRSLFWPFVLLAVGIIWLSLSLGGMQSENLWALFHIWPYLLIVIGVGVILRSRWSLLGRIVSASSVVIALLAIVFAAQLGWNTPQGWCMNGSSSFPECNINLGNWGSVAGSGVVISETRTLDDFTSISVDYPADITVHQGETQTVTIKADDNLIPQIVTRVSGSKLYIEEKNVAFNQRVNPTKTVQIDLTVKNLTIISFPSAGTVDVEGLKTDSLELDTSGAGKITLNNLNVQNLGVDLSGAGGIEVMGTAKSLDLNISGVGSFNGQNLSVASASVDISGVGSATLWVTQELTANISGVGSVNYYGSPQLNQKIGRAHV